MIETLTVDSGTAVSTPVPRQRFQLGNHLESAALEVDEDGALITYEEYHPYGTTAWWASNGSTDVSAKRYRYTGKEKDEETGLAYHGARYYAAWLGRWERPDPKPDPRWSRYEYCRCSPPNLVDADGAKPLDVMGAALGAAAAWYPRAVAGVHEGFQQGAKAFASDPVGTVKSGLQKDAAVVKAGAAVVASVSQNPVQSAVGVTGFLLSHGTVAGIQGQMNAAVAADDVAAGSAAGRDLGAMVTLGMAGEGLGPVIADAAGPLLSRLAKFADDPFDMAGLVPDDMGGAFSEVADDLRPKLREWDGGTADGAVHHGVLSNNYSPTAIGDPDFAVAIGGLTYAEAHIVEDGILQIGMNAKAARALGHSGASGRYAFHSIVAAAEATGEVRAIRGIWVEGDNLAAFLKAGGGPGATDAVNAAAAGTTFTAREAAKAGFTGLKVESVTDEMVRVLFTRPGG
jgi:RHS repeat-associated protein